MSSDPPSHPSGAGSAIFRRAVVVAVHVIGWTATYFGAFGLRFDTLPREHLRAAAISLGFLLVLRTLAFWWMGLFHGILRYAGIPEMWSIVKASTLSTLALGVANLATQTALPRSIYLTEVVLSIGFAAGLRLLVRLTREGGVRATAGGEVVRPVIVLGAGDAAEMFLRDLERRTQREMRVVALLDDDASKHGSEIRGVRVQGAVNEETLRTLATRYDVRDVVLAMPAAAGDRTRAIMSVASELKLRVRTLPSFDAILSGSVRVSALRELVIEDLLRREPVRLDERSLATMLQGKRVMITGGAGSIGSELARQVCRHGASSIALFDHNENGLFFLERELKAAHPKMRIRPIIGDIKDPARVREVLADLRPHVILHAAAHKHVPLMEDNPAEAVKNNVFGTKVVADLANAMGVETFILISTDKAVNPTSVMGATKRVAEMYIQSLAGTARSRFAAVRFGNVLGSAGSVVQVFREQIAAGGPVTVTHPDMRRYFMTIPEASQLVLQAGAFARGGEVFVLDMGDLVKVVDLAKDMIRMSGLEPDVDIEVKFTGQRPGEKLYEELFRERDSFGKTLHDKIYVGSIEPLSQDQVDGFVAELQTACAKGTAEAVRTALSRIIPDATLQGAAIEDHSEAVVARLSQSDFALRPSQA